MQKSRIQNFFELSDLARRVITAVVVLPVLVWTLFAWSLGPQFLIAIAIAGGIWELVGLFAPTVSRRARLLSVVSGLGLAGSVWFSAHTGITVLIVAGLMAAMALWTLVTQPPNEAGLKNFGALVTPLLVVATPLSLLGLLGAEAGAAWVALTFLVAWFGDAGSYFVGRAFGRHKLAPTVSPNKTIEGAVGGLVVAGILAVTAGTLLMPEVAAWKLLVIAIPANALGQTADLFESWIKRSRGVKDSGDMIPGYGGMLDKTDSLLFAAPWVYGAWQLLCAG